MSLIVFTGKFGTGKSYLSAYLESRYNFTLLKFAEPIYKIQSKIQTLLGLPQEKDRILMQTVGKWGRGKDKQFWINIYQKKIDELRQSGVQNIVTDDLRFDNEALAVRALGGVIIKVKGKSRIDQIGADDESEMGISPHLIDFEIENDKDDTYDKLEEILQKLGIKNDISGNSMVTSNDNSGN